jgi:archaellum biogenesis protein FlaJ (TadC family)
VIHRLYSKINFLEKYIPKSFLEEKNLLKTLNFVDLKLLDKEYILISFFMWLVLFFLFLITYIIYFLIFYKLPLGLIAITQLFLALSILVIYYYPFFLAKRKINLIEEEFTMFFLHLKILVESGLNLNNIVYYIVTQENLPYSTIQKEFKRIFNYSKIENLSIERAFTKIIRNYPESFAKSILLELINYQKENEDLRKFVKKTWEKIEKKNEAEENKFYDKLDFIMDFYSIVLLIFPFLIILTTFIFDSVNFVLGKIIKENFSLNNSIFYKTILVLLLLIPIFYLLTLIIIDSLVPKHLKFLRKLKEYVRKNYENF